MISASRTAVAPVAAGGESCPTDPVRWRARRINAMQLRRIDRVAAIVSTRCGHPAGLDRPQDRAFALAARISGFSK